ncbi:hypothetical protein IQ37_00910 [Chryseobacterium piperi]|uniref:DUF4595 domain-containing protein n=1 Tax=Chryseobacterium piperi TaxID=558152 RepID=A0A086BN57_9FLAO|nr:hypothetical protein [Chryseobacterium piperi]ASW75165.1 hypothetical protein CJF12_13315 [Chryseobacterium piperi]KFF30371.1 hypothetical protein IQ37_00910 [Chryseobacterium piperi]
MKKLFISSLVLAAMSSCGSSDDTLPEVNNNNNGGTPLLLTKATEVTDDGQTYTVQFKYDGDRLIESYNNVEQEKTVYTYNGDNIIKTEDYEAGVMKMMREFTYTNGRVSSEKVTNKNAGTLVYTKAFQYISATHVKFNEYSSSTFNPSTGVHSDIKFSQNDVQLSSGGNIATMVSVDNGRTTTSTYNYDTKNHPMKNIRGYLKIDLFYLSDGELGYNNLLNMSSNYSGTVSGSLGSTATHTYNANNFPTKTVMNYTSTTFPASSTTYTYEYNQ